MVMTNDKIIIWWLTNRKTQKIFWLDNVHTIEDILTKMIEKFPLSLTLNFVVQYISNTSWSISVRGDEYLLLIGNWYHSYESPLAPTKNKFLIRYYGFTIRYYGFTIRYYGFILCWLMHDLCRLPYVHHQAQNAADRCIYRQPGRATWK